MDIDHSLRSLTFDAAGNDCHIGSITRLQPRENDDNKVKVCKIDD
jgi:hypothetical protein